MNNTLSHPGLSYNHPSCTLHHPSHSQFIQQNVAHTAASSHPQISNCFTNAAITQQNTSTQVSNHARLNQGSQLQAIQKHPNSFPHHSHNHHNVSNMGLPIHLSACNLPVTNSSSMFTQTSVYINPYMGVPYPTTHTHYAHQHPSLLPAHMHPHHYIAPSMGFNVSQTNNSSNNCSSQVSPSVSNCYSSRAPVAASKSVASTVHYATEPGNHSYAGVPSTATGALVPYNAATLSAKSPSLMQARYMSVPKSSAESSLFTKLQKTHLSYLNTEDSPEKLELRKEMDELIQHLVSVTPHELKFGFSEVRQVLEESVCSQPQFDAFKAASAFEALAGYATNLVMQPWRREYWSIKLYCGYWVHQVSSHLHCPELILRTMGYETASGGDSSFELLGGMADADIVARLALDCHVACGECQVLGQLQQEVPQLSYTQLLQYRQLSTGTVHHTALSLQHCFRSADEEDEQGKDGRDAKGDRQLALVSERQVVAAGDRTVAALPDRQLVQSSDLCDGAPRPVPRSYNLHRSSSRSSLNDEKFSIKSKQVGEQQQPDRLVSPSHGQEGGSRAAGRMALDLSTGHSSSSGRLLPASSSSRYPESPDGRPSRPERGREGGGSSRRLDDYGSGTGGGAVATARLIDHEEEQQQTGSTGGRRTGGGRTEGGAAARHSRRCLPQVLPHSRSSHKSNSHMSDPSGGNLFHLSDSTTSRHLFPSEVFEDSTFEEHLRESYALLKQEQQQQQRRASSSGGNNGPSYKDTWGFVMSDLEKKGYNKDVGNRGDILQNSRPSSTNVSTSITVANTPATLVCSSGRLAADQRNTIVSSVSRPLIPSTIRSSSRQDAGPLKTNTMRNSSRQEAAVLIPSTVRNVRQLSPSPPPPPLPSRPYPAASSTLSMNDALEQLDLNSKLVVLVPSVSSSSGCGGTARNKSRANDRYRAGQSRYSSTADKFSSNSTGVVEENTTDKRNSVYDNVSCEGFETARQDTDEEEDGVGRGMILRRGEYCRQGGDVGGSRHHIKHSPPSCGGSISSSDSVSNTSGRYTNALETSNLGMASLSKRSPLTHASSKTVAQQLLHSTEDLHYVAANNSSKQPTGSGGRRSSSSNNSSSGGSTSSDAPVVGESLIVFPWSCETCTYANERERLVCEMCGRSRAPPCERVAAAAGRACGQCTLINEEEALSCQACGYSLEPGHAYV